MNENRAVPAIVVGDCVWGTGTEMKTNCESMTFVRQAIW